MAESMPQLVWSTTAEGYHDYYNDRWYEYTGMPREGEQGWNWRDFVHPDDLGPAMELWQRSLRNGDPYEVEYRLREADTGAYRWFLGRAMPLHNADGRIVRWFGTCTDIDDAKHTEAALGVLSEAGAVLGESLDVEAALREVARLIVPRLADWCAIDLVAPDGSPVRIAVEHTDPTKVRLARELAERYPEDPDSPSGIRKVFRSGESEFGPDILEEMLEQSAQSPEHLAAIRALGLRSYIVVPIREASAALDPVLEPPDRPAILGAITLIIAETGRRYAKRDLETANELARRVSFALERSRLYEVTKANEARLEEQAEELTAQAEQAQSQALELEMQATQLQEQAAEMELQHEELQLTADQLIQRGRDLELARETAAREAEVVKTLVEVGISLASELDGERLMQSLTDQATRLSDAQFGAFFYNVEDEVRGSYMLYALAGVEPEAFSSFPMPRNTGVFAPTFRGEATVRSADITADPRYGRNDPYFGMPKGHLPVRSYLAVPVVRRNGEVLGGLFFGHADPDRFDAGHQRLVEGIAAWAAIAIDNAQLYESERRSRSEAESARAEAEEANRAKSDFLAAMSHELRTPLNAIAGYADLLLLGIRGVLTPEQREDIEKMKRSGQHLLSLINDILNFAKLEAGQIEFRIEPVALVDLLDELRDLVTPQVDARGLAYSAEPCHPSIRALADPEKVKQILLNLVTNAIKFTEPGGRIEVLCSTRRGQVRIEVRDTGRGIPQEQQHRIFDPFVQVDRQLTPLSQQGVGLGLAISRDLARAMEGSLSVESAVNEGSTFCLALPSAEPEP